MENKFLSKKMMKSALIVEKPFRLEKILSLQVMYGKNEPSEVVDATCDKDGKKVYHCWNCDETKEETIPATGHEYGDYVTVKEATCEIESEEQTTCSKCGDVIKKNNPSIGT